MFWKLFSTEKLHLRVLKSPVRLKFKPHLIASWVPTKDYYIPMKSFYFWDLQGQVKQASIPNTPRIRLNVKPEILNYSKTYIYFKNILVLANKDFSVKQIERIMSSKRRRSLAQQGFQNYFYNNCLISRALIGSFVKVFLLTWVNNNNELYLHSHKRELQHCKSILRITKNSNEGKPNNND